MGDGAEEVAEADAEAEFTELTVITELSLVVRGGLMTLTFCMETGCGSGCVGDPRSTGEPVCGSMICIGL
jgi:hypothetical protein